MSTPTPDPPAPARSPYERALGARRTELDPRLTTYFSSLGPDEEGAGRGVFTTFGSPRVRLREEAGCCGATQRVSLTIDVPLLGRLHAYTGTFTYEIEQETP